MGRQIKIFDEQNDAFAVAFALAFVFIYMVLASQFESFKHPFTIMVSLPLALVGALVALVLTGKHLSLGAMIGIILLMGLVTKNAILLVDGALQRIREGKDVNAALLEAGPRRLRPILMTSFAMAIGMLPTAIGTGTGSEFRAPMAIAVIGGVIASTALTLLVVPVIFAAMERASIARLFRRRGEVIAVLFRPRARERADRTRRGERVSGRRDAVPVDAGRVVAFRRVDPSRARALVLRRAQHERNRKSALLGLSADERTGSQFRSS